VACQEGCCPQGSRNGCLPSFGTVGRNPRQVVEFAEQNKLDLGRKEAYQPVQRLMPDRGRLHYTSENSDALAGQSVPREAAQGATNDKLGTGRPKRALLDCGAPGIGSAG
jgi:hypothetical protein